MVFVERVGNAPEKSPAGGLPCDAARAVRCLSAHSTCVSTGKDSVGLALGQDGPAMMLGRCDAPAGLRLRLHSRRSPPPPAGAAGAAASTPPPPTPFNVTLL